MKVYSKSQKKVIEVPDTAVGTQQAKPEVLSAGIDVQNATQAPKKGGFIRDVATALVKPAVDAGKLVLGTGFEAVRAADAALGNRDAYDVQKGKKNPFLSREEIQKDYSNPTYIATNVGKKAAGVASYMVPGGPGVSGAIKTGAAAGGLHGLSQSKSKDVEGMAVDTAIGAGGGAIAGGVMGGAGKVIEKLKGAGDATRKSVINPKVKSSPTMSSKEDAIVKGTQSLGMKGSAATQKVQMDKIYKDLGAEIETKLTGKKGDLNDVLEGVDDAINNNSNKLPGYETWVKHFGDQVLDASEKGNHITDRALYDLKKKIGEQVSKGFDKENGISQVALTAKEDIGLAIWHKIDDLLTKINPAVKEVTKKMSTLHNAAPGLDASAKKGLTVPIVGNIGPGANAIKQSAQDLTGRVLQKIGGAAKSVPQVASDMAIKGGAILSGGIPPSQDSTTPPAVLGEEKPITQDQTGANGDYITEGDKIYSNDKQWMWDDASNDWVPSGNSGIDFSNEETVVQLMQQDLEQNGGKNIPEIKSMYEIAKTKMGSKMNATQQKRMATLNQAQGIYDMVEELALDAPEGLMGVGQATIGKLPGVEGGSAEDLERTTRALAKGIAGAMANEVGVATNRDIERWMGLMPKVTDTLDERKRVMDRLKTALQLAKDQISTLQGDTPDSATP